MKKYLGLLLLLVSFTSFGQFSNYTNINGRYKWIAGKFDSTFTIPSGTTPSLRVGGGTGPGALFYSTTDSTVYQYTGTRWTRLRGTDTAHVVSAYVRNTTASTMTAGQVVYINGSTGTTPTIALAVNTADSTSAMTFGFVRGTIAPNAFGWITTFGPLEGVNTNAYTEGEVIYLDSIPGQFTHFKPQAPYHMVTLGYIVKKSGGNGTIFAKVQNGYELEELHNVRITSPVRNNGILAYDSVAQLWKDTTLSAIGGVTGSGTSGQVAYWTGTSSQSGSNNLFWDAANGRLGIGTNAPASSLQITSAATLATGIQFNNAGSIGYILGDGTSMSMRAGATLGISVVSSSAGLQQANSSTGGFRIDLQTLTNTPIYTFAFDANTGIGRAADDVLTFYSGGERARFTSGGNFLLNQTTDGGQRLQVNGDVLFKGSGNTSGTTALTVQNSTPSNLFRVLNNGWTQYGSDNVGPLAFQFSTSRGTADLTGTNLQWYSYNAANSASVGRFYFTGANMTQTSGANYEMYIGHNFSPTSGTATYGQLALITTINQTGGANGVTRGLYVNPTLTAAADWRSIEWSNNSGWGLYGAGTANNYLGGNLGIGSTGITNVNLRIERNIEGSTGAYGVLVGSQIRSGVTAQALGYTSNPSIQNTAFTLSQLRHFYAVGISSAGSATITNQSGFYVETSLTGATNNFGFYGDIASGTGRWNLYMNGTAANYMNGNLLLGSTVDGGQKLQITGTTQLTGTGTTSATTALTVRNSSGTTYLQIRNDGSVIGNAAATAIGAIWGLSQYVAFQGKTLTLAGTAGGGNDFLINSFSINSASVVNGSMSFNTFNNSFTHSNTGAYNSTIVSISPTINQTGGANGITRGLYINPTLTSAADWRSLEWSNNTGFGLYGAGTATNYLGGTLGIGTTSPNASAILELSSTTKGFLPPRMTGTEAEAIASPSAGLLVFITNGNGTTITSVGWWGYDSSGWVKLN